MILSQKKNFLSPFYAAFSKSILNFKYFEIKYGPHRLCISETTDSGNVVR